MDIWIIVINIEIEFFLMELVLLHYLSSGKILQQ